MEKIIYEVVKIEENKIFIIPNLHEKIIITSRATLNNFYDHVHKNWCNEVKIIFGFRKFSFSEGLKYEWKLVESFRAGPAGMGATLRFRLQKYEGEVPQESEITGFPSSSLFDL